MARAVINPADRSADWLAVQASMQVVDFEQLGLVSVGPGWTSSAPETFANRMNCPLTSGGKDFRSGTRIFLPTRPLTVRPNGADHQWKEDPLM